MRSRRRFWIIAEFAPTGAGAISRHTERETHMSHALIIDDNMVVSRAIQSRLAPFDRALASACAATRELALCA